ncbi:hypothetical protein [Sphingobacterium siyangense]|uniref:hypothetical protein n=1 Tax=Sphingobacterium siyangense TaxID=459529 RepID=UPI00301B40D1
MKSPIPYNTILKSNNSYYYRIAAHILKINCPIEISLNEYLPSFTPFTYNTTSVEENILIHADIVLEKAPPSPLEAKLLSDISAVWEDRFCFEESTDYYITTVLGKNGNTEWKMFSSKDFRKTKIYADLSDGEQKQGILSWFLMVCFGQAVLPYRTLMIHGSVIKKNNEAFVFLGKSGTGKSTHSRLWLQHIPDTSLLNDDNPAIRISKNNAVEIYGTPWSGKTPCYKNDKAELSAIIRLRQAPANKMSWLSNTNAFIGLLPSTSSIRWNRTLFGKMNDTVSEIIEKIPIGLLDCLPDAAAAILCHNEIKSKTKTISYE